MRPAKRSGVDAQGKRDGYGMTGAVEVGEVRGVSR